MRRRKGSRYRQGSVPLVDDGRVMSNVEDRVLLSSGMKSVRAYEKRPALQQWLLYYLPCIATLGVWFFICKRFIGIKLFCRFRIARSIEHTSIVRITDLNGNIHLSKLKRLRILKEDAYGLLDSMDMQGQHRANQKRYSAQEFDESLYEEYIIFEFQQLRYVFDHVDQRFKMQHMDTHEIVHRCCNRSAEIGLDSTTHRHRLIQFGSNHIDIKPEKKWKRFVKTTFEPLHRLMFIVIVLLLIKQELSFRYILYALLMLGVNIFSIYLSFKQKSASLRLLKDLVGSYGRELRVIRDGESFMAGSASLVPGDVVEITGRVTLPCDMVLIRGHVEVDESMITGDTVPAQKVPVQSYDDEASLLNSRARAEKDNNHHAAPIISVIQQENTLIGGSKTLSAKYTPDPEQDSQDQRFKSADPNAAIAVVIRTGFNSSKGKIIREVLNSLQTEKVHPYIRDTDTFTRLIFVGGMVCSFLSLLFFFVQRFSSPLPWNSIVDALDLLLCMFPPFLPIIVSWPARVANKRLKNAKIQATSLKSLLQFGAVDCVCYDKTGTLTDDTLGFYGALETVATATFSSDGQVKERFSFVGHVHKSPMEISEQVFNVMACCHNLSKINNDEVTGDRLEIALFNETNYELKRNMGQTQNSDHQGHQQPESSVFIVHPPPEFNERGMIQVVHIYPFSSDLRRMSVVTRFPTACIYCKGSPKSIRSICRPESIPEDYDVQVRKFGLRGFRIIAVAHRELSGVEDDLSWPMKREDAERDMQFLGFIIMKNKLHEETIPELRKLAAGNTKRTSNLRKRWKSRIMSEEDDAETITLHSEGRTFTDVNLSSTSSSARDIHLMWTGDADGGIDDVELAAYDDTRNDAHENDDSRLYYNMQTGESPSAALDTSTEDGNDQLSNRIRTIMITGDTAYTAIAVARECGMIDPRRRILLAEVDDGQHGEKLPRVVWRQVAEPSNGDYSDANTDLVITGYAFSLLRNHRKTIGDMRSTSTAEDDVRTSDAIITDHGLRQHLLYNKLIVRTNIFTEMLPLQKAELISDLKALDYTVAMCGDGSNDSMALIAADVSLSISEAETSYAAQFTSTENRHCVSFMIGDSRALLDKILHNFKFLSLFILIQVMYFSHHFLHAPNQFQLIWSGFVIGFVIIFCNAFSSSMKHIRPNRPPLRFISLPLLFSVAGQALVQFAFFSLASAIVVTSDWYSELSLVTPDTGILHKLHTSFLFMISNFQFLAVACAFNFNYQFTRPWRNVMLITALIALLILNMVILWPIPPMPNTYIGTRIGGGGINTAFGMKIHFPNAVWVSFGMMREPADYEIAYAYWVLRVFVGLPLVVINVVISWLCEFLIQKAVELWKSRTARHFSSGELYKQLIDLVQKRRTRQLQFRS